MGRFAGKTIADLRKVAMDAVAQEDHATINELVTELEVRIQRRTQQGRPAKREQQEFLDELQAGVVAPPNRVPIVVADPETPDNELQRKRREVEIWRALYGAESEAMALWGMTASLPFDIVQEVLKLWAAKVEHKQVDAVRTKARLASDSKIILARTTNREQR
jgi:hypothetical protein